jgi:hypothetical protein
MPIFDFLSGQFIDVIHWTDDTRDTMVWRFEREGHEIKYGAKLTVREGQSAVFVHEGQLADVFTPGLYMLETNNMPIMTTLQHWDHGFRSPFKSEIYFVATTRFTNLKWGTKNPIMLRDPEFGPTRIRAFGTYTVRVTDPARFLSEIVGTDGEFTRSATSSCRRFPASSRAAASRCWTWPPTPPIWARWWPVRSPPWSPNTGWKSRNSTLKTYPCRPPWNRRSTSAPRWGWRAIWAVSPSIPPPRR